MLDVVGRVDGWINPMHRPFHAALRERAARPDVADRIAFLGWRDDAPELMAGAGVHCCPSRAPEGFGLVVLEAKSAGLPSVVMPSGALPSLVEHRTTGWICETVSAAALAEGLAYFLIDPERQAAAGDAARASLERFGRDRFAREWMTLLAGGPVHGGSERSPSRVGDRGRRLSRRAPDAYVAGVAAGSRHRAR
jgi:glycosyltransferase involved in cell wall biosynthesis